MSFAIVVRVPEAKESCFVATPFNPHFNTLNNAVAAAAQSLGLAPVQLNRQHPGPEFTQTVVEEIRAARVVVGVCSPEPGAAEANVNVLFEVGLANALGKAVLLLTDQRQAIPSDLCNRDMLVYDSGSVANGHLQDQVEARLGGLIRRMRQNLLTDPFYKDISVAEAHHWRILHPEWWSLFLGILRLAKRIHHEFQSLDSGYLDKLRNSAEQVVCNYHEGGSLLDIPMKTVNALDDMCYDMVDYYHSRTNRKILSSWGEQSVEGEQLFASLMGFVNADLREQQDRLRPQRPQIQKLEELRIKLIGCKTLFDDVKGKITGYPGFLGPIVDMKDFRDRIRTPEMIAIQHQITELSRRTKSIIIQADNLILELLEVLMEEEGPRD